MPTEKKLSKKIWSAAELTLFAHRFQQLSGRTLRRRDLRPDRAYQLTQEFIQAGHRDVPEFPAESTVLAWFPSFSNYMDLSGLRDTKLLPGEISRIELAGIQHCVETLSMIPETAERSVTDGWIETVNPISGIKQTLRVEVKTTTVAPCPGRSYNTFGWNIHEREYSKIADLLVLVGLDDQHNPVCRFEIPQVHLARLVDRRVMLRVYTNAIWGFGNSGLKPFLRWRVPVQPVINQASNQASNQAVSK
jgi:hypothetical protein